MHNSVDTFFVHLLFGSNSAFLDHFALTVTNAWLWVPLYVAFFFLIIKNHASMQQILICAGCAVLGVLIATGLTSVVTKPLFARLRPCNDPEYKYLAYIAGNIHNRDFSFFSSHAATSMSLVAFFTFLVRSRLLSVSLCIWSLVVCWSRLYLGQHFFTDIVVGILWGNIAGIFAFLLYNKVCKRQIRRFNVSEKFTTSGFNKMDVDTIVLVLTITFLYSIIPF